MKNFTCRVDRKNLVFYVSGEITVWATWMPRPEKFSAQQSLGLVRILRELGYKADGSLDDAQKGIACFHHDVQLFAKSLDVFEETLTWLQKKYKNEVSFIEV